MFSVAWFYWLVYCFFELVVLFRLALLLVGFLFRVCWLGWLGLKFFFENFQFLPQVLSWLVGLLIFEFVVFFTVSCLFSWFVVSGWFVGLVGVEVSL